jgi:transcriptional regulator with XRE-family HTH domain
MSFSTRLKEIRREKKLTQEQLGQKVNVTKVSISGYESGNRTPDMDTLQKIADVLEISVDYLLGRTDTSSDANYIGENKDSYKISSAYHKYEKLTDEEKDYLDLQLEIFRKIKEDKK